jgi:hypothetical protein
MVNLSVEEPDALMCARPGLWEPWVGNCPGPPGPRHPNGDRFGGRNFVDSLLKQNIKLMRRVRQC